MTQRQTAMMSSPCLATTTTIWLCVSLTVFAFLAATVNSQTYSDQPCSSDVNSVFVSYDVTSDKFEVKDAEDEYTVARARFQNCINSTGWSYLSVDTDNPYTYRLNSSVQAYAAGLAEGYITRDLISMHRHNTAAYSCAPGAPCEAVVQFLKDNIAWVMMGVGENPDDDYWYQVRLFYEQFRGLQDGYNGKPGRISMTVDDVLGLYLMQLQYEVDDIAKAVNPSSSAPSPSHCSVLIKLVQGQGQERGQGQGQERGQGQGWRKVQRQGHGYHHGDNWNQGPNPFIGRNWDKDTSQSQGHGWGKSQWRGQGRAWGKGQGQVAGGVKDVLMAHDTWTTYNNMLRVLKHYKTFFHKSPTVSEPALGRSWAFSSYPGVLTSLDDFYVLSSAMVTIETTNSVYNKSLYKLVTPHSVPEGIRVTVANRLAEHGEDWSSTFSRYNSGTYNNQWMVIDLKKYDEYNQDILPGFLTVLEQMPGKVHYEDVTNVLLNQSYWASYNVPYFPEVYERMGYPAKAAEFGEFYTHDQTPRAQMFRRGHEAVKDMDSLTKMMRYNDYQHDPLSRCNCTPPYSAALAISSRKDLNPPDGTYPFGSLGFGLSGGTDMKATSLQMTKDKLAFRAISGPTFDPVPPFRWSTAFNASSVSHLGHPDLFQFGPVWFDGNF